MRYRIASSGAKRTELVLSMPEKPLLTAFLILASVACLVTGLAFALAADAHGDAATAVGFLGFGLFCLCALFFLAGGLPYPARLAFDNTRGWLSAHDRRGALLGAVPYNGITGVSLMRSVSERILRHSAGLDLKRGGRWELYASRSEERAQAFRDALAAGLRLSTVPTEAPGPVPGLVPERGSDGGVRYSWRRKPRPLPLAVSLAAGAGFAAALAGIGAFSSNIATSVVALGFAAVLVSAAAVSLLRAAGERLEVHVYRGTVSYHKSSLFTRGKGFSMGLPRVAAVDLSFSFTRVESAISLLAPEEVEPFRRYRQGTFSPSETLEMLSFLRSLHRIDVSALPFGQRLGLAEAIREALTSPASAG